MKNMFSNRPHPPLLIYCHISPQSFDTLYVIWLGDNLLLSISYVCTPLNK